MYSLAFLIMFGATACSQPGMENNVRKQGEVTENQSVVPFDSLYYQRCLSNLSEGPNYLLVRAEINGGDHLCLVGNLDLFRYARAYLGVKSDEDYINQMVDFFESGRRLKLSGSADDEWVGLLTWFSVDSCSTNFEMANGVEEYLDKGRFIKASYDNPCFVASLISKGYYVIRDDFSGRYAVIQDMSFYDMFLEDWD